MTNPYREIDLFDPCFAGRLDVSNTIHDISTGPMQIHDVIEFTMGICAPRTTYTVDPDILTTHEYVPEDAQYITFLSKKYILKSESIHRNRIPSNNDIAINRSRVAQLAVLGKVLTKASDKEAFAAAAHSIIHLRSQENHATARAAFTLIGGNACLQLKESLQHEMDELQTHHPISFLGDMALEIFGATISG